jgi:hypothetical protein
MRTRTVYGRYPALFRTGSPDTTTTGVGSEHVGFGRHDLGTYFLRLDVGTSPQTSLTNGHVEEVFPSLRLKVFPELLHLFSSLQCTLGSGRREGNFGSL